MQEDLDKAFNNLSLDEQSTFIVSNILNNKNFIRMHNYIKRNYSHSYLQGEELIKHKLKVNNYRLKKLLFNELNTYEKAVDKCLAKQSRYKDIVYKVYDAQRNIEEYCKSKYINGDPEILDVVVDSYNSTEGTIYEYGGERSGFDDQTLKTAVIILLKNPYLDEKIKNSKEYKEFYDEFINEDSNINIDINDIKYNEDDINSEEDRLTNDDDNNTEDSDNTEGYDDSDSTEGYDDSDSTEGYDNTEGYDDSDSTEGYEEP